MAKKNEAFSYGASAIPAGEAKYSVIRWGWNGLNRTDTIDTGAVSDASGVLIDPPYVIPSVSAKFMRNYPERISIFGFGENLLVIYRSSGKIKADVITPSGAVYTGTLGNALGTDADFRPRTAVQFNVAEDTENIVESTFVRKILIFPDAYSMDFDVSGNFTPASLGNTYPGLKYAAVYASRVFGVDDNLVYASRYNDYADWALDTADEISDSNAWVSMSQSNVRADGAFTAIAVHDNHVVLFKPDFMQLVYNNKNPFRIVDVGSYGCVGPYAVTDLDGVLYFASADKVYAYAGGTPRDIGKNLDIDSLRGAVLGSYGDTVYLAVGDELFAYKSGVWSCLGVQESPIMQFATTDYGIFSLHENGDIKALAWSENAIEDILGDASGWAPDYNGEWWFETDFMALGKLDVRRVVKVSLLCDIAPGASVSVYLLRGGEKFDPASAVCVGESDGDGRVLIRVMTRQFASYMHRLRIVGHGYAKIYAAELKISWGGDVYVEG